MGRIITLAAICTFLFNPVTTAQETAEPELVSPLGIRHFATPAQGEALAKLEEDLVHARAAHAADPGNAELAIAHGRALAYLWRYHAAIEVFSEAIQGHPDHALLYRHRGHRYISIRDFAAARADLIRAAELKSDDFDIWYHLGLAHFLNDETPQAADAFARAYACVDDDDSRIAAQYWRHLSLAGRSDLSGITATMEVKENLAYHRLLLCFKGELSAEEILAASAESPLDTATTRFGLGYIALARGQEADAKQHFIAATASPYWPAFGYIAAETMLARMGYRP
jgi:Flp pilus assembly protein TadD